MWKKAFVTILSLNLMLLVGITLWFGTLPSASSAHPEPSPSVAGGRPATVQLAVGQSAINTYLEYALSEQADMKRVLSYARVQFNDAWDVEVGMKLSGKIISCDVRLQPTISAGNLQLHVVSAQVGDLPMPTSLIMLIFRHVAWPQWIVVDSGQQNLDINFSKRPQHPYGIHMVSYSPATKRLTMSVSILPKALLSKAHPAS